MLDSLYMRPRGRALAAKLHRITGGRIKQAPDWVQEWIDAPTVSIDLRARELGAPMEPGPVSDHFFALLGDETVAEVERRLDGELAELWDAAGESNRRPLAVALALHYGIPGVAERTGLSAAMPPEGVHSMARGPAATGGAYGVADYVVEALTAAGLELEPGLRILDFGCSSGRVARVLTAAYPELDWHGCDPLAEAVEWARDHLDGATFAVSPQDPPLDYDTGYFDAAYAISVWSHFGQDTAVAWLEEMHRIIRPGGLLVFTVQGWHTLHRLAIDRAWEKPDVERCAQDLFSRGFSFVDTFDDERGGDHGLTHPSWGWGLLTPAWLFERLRGSWLVVDFVPGRVEGSQDLVTIRRLP